MNLSFYDISLVDGYNLPVGIVSLHTESKDPALASIPSNTTNPVCIGSVDFFVSDDNSSSAIHAISRWCPWPLQLQAVAPPKPGAGVYPYPDDDIPRPRFDPCISSCAKYGNPEDCCAGAFNSPETCTPNEYSRKAKSVCPDAYSYAYDDKTSTFTIKAGAGFEVVFCPDAGRSTDIMRYKDQDQDQG
ncbi:hypothetical protein T310_1828 [Rasamsonia emersonii CBS 393.64]|uniref:Osmotin, thaumatin-like protein n=1 Tax=Rasamsonia emersonii (strain ATCC 16479 / CBS 393.64 / IMI 116815) TaxID=1408163 RepID=A0A0F4Z279_RASE3|nr:hypothetical protein T310_1828 [Rasamsonia emersonii CBS 393.64]KKA24176.1 hypothetical protein T310_1828 [Rasamsonia emersonii CBS 393.64]